MISLGSGAHLREGRGKTDAGRLRRSGLVPLTVYGDGNDAVSAASEQMTLLNNEQR